MWQRQSTFEHRIAAVFLDLPDHRPNIALFAETLVDEHLSCYSYGVFPVTALNVKKDGTPPQPK